MAEIERIDELEPYKSLVLARIGDDAKVTTLIKDCLNDIESILDLSDEEDEDAERERIKVAREADSRSREERLVHGYIHYRLRKSVSWAAPPGVKDTENHLVLLTRKRATNCLALYASENSRRRAIRRAFSASDWNGLRHLSQVDPEQLNAAFFGETVRTLWLSGMHRRVPVKADAKILSGTDLEYALDPVNDQTFYYSAVRSSHDTQIDELRTVGLSPKKSRIWTRQSPDWSNYREGVNQILSRLNRTFQQDQSENRPLPVLAEVSDGTGDLGSPYDLVIQPPELLSSDVEQEETELEEIEQWAYDAHFDVLDSSKAPSVEAKVYHRGDLIGDVSLNIDASDPTEVTIQEVETEVEDEESDEHENLLSELEDLCSSTRKLKVYYDSAHTLSDGSLYSVQFRDQPFSQFLWASFGNEYEITKEKPDDFPGEGNDVSWDQDDQSLFRWVYENWPPSGYDRGPWSNRDDHPKGWLAIDDGAMEIADFIHFDPHPEEPVLTLIHVKGSGSNSDGREISVANYEVVTGQAVKNLRNLDHRILESGLEEGIENEVGRFVWEDGNPSDRDQMINEIQGLDSEVKRRVVVVQPHIRQEYYSSVRDGSGGQNETRLKQLDTLLHGAKQACNGLQAEFWVIAADA